MSESVGISRRVRGMSFGHSTRMQHHQKTALTRLGVDRPRRFLRTDRSCAFTPPSMALFVAGSGPSADSAGSRYVNSVPALTRETIPRCALRRRSCA